MIGKLARILNKKRLPEKLRKEGRDLLNGLYGNTINNIENLEKKAKRFILLNEGRWKDLSLVDKKIKPKQKTETEVETKVETEKIEVEIEAETLEEKYVDEEELMNKLIEKLSKFSPEDLEDENFKNYYE
jgi:hypothetical protein